MNTGLPRGQWFSLLLLAALAAASYWLEQRSTEVAVMPVIHTGGDFTSTQVQVAQYLPQGDLQYRLTAQSMHQFSEARTDARVAVLEQLDHGVVNARFATPVAQWLDKGARVVFPQAVEIVARDVQDGEPVHVVGSAVTLDVTRHWAESEQPLVADSAFSHVTATGFDYDWKSGDWHLHHKVHMVYAQKH